MSKLIVYKASAGSGKTYTLTLRYLELLFNNEVAYRNILAVTFTNKAASEMKNRIMETLYRLSGYQPTSPVKPDYLEHLSETCNIPEDEVCKRAGKILYLILNDFSHFSVGTIDRFFQMVIRSFTREIGLQTGYNLELNNSKVLGEAVDNLLYSMDENQDLREWLIQFAEEEIMEGRNFNLKADLIVLGKEIFKENYRSLSHLATTADMTSERIREYQKILLNELNTFRGNLIRISREALSLIDKSGLEANDFSYKESGAPGYFYSILSGKKKETEKYLPLKTPRKAIDNPEVWYTKTSDKKDLILEAYNRGLNTLLKEAINYTDRNYIRFRTALEIYKFIYAYGILTDLLQKVREITSEKNMFLLSDSSEFLNEIIAENEAPFVYEKAGNSFHHFMLDEFQDTSVFQWNNFRPLLHNGLSSNFDSLIVGDVKQSIYRWRNSDWKILADEVSAAFPYFYHADSLQENYRSTESIIRFNNTVFRNAPGLLKELYLSAISESDQHESLSALADKITMAYANSIQMIPQKSKEKDGYVKFSFLEKNSNKERYLEIIKEKLPETIVDLQKRGYHAGDIAILVRKGEEGEQLASMFLEYKNRNSEQFRDVNFNVISNDSLFISANPAVKLLVAVMKRMHSPSDMLNEVFIRHEFLVYLNEGIEVPEDTGLIFTGKTMESSTEFAQIYKSLDLCEEKLRHMSLFELSEALCEIFKLNKNAQDVPYLQAFQEILLSFMKKESSDLNAFLDYWEEVRNKETLNISEHQDAIRIFTIHKAKGLEFPVVIIPFCNWDIQPSSSMKNILWCKTPAYPFDYLPFVPVNYGSGLANTYFSRDYFSEMLHSFVDSLNLSYVAFTRAINELHIFASPGEKIQNIGDLIYSALLQKSSENDPGSLMKEDLIKISSEEYFEYGIKKKEIPVYAQQDYVEEIFNSYPIAAFPKKVKLRYRSEEFFIAGAPGTGNINYGIIMHEILSDVKRKSDLESAVNKSFLEGKIDSSKRSEILGLLSVKLSSHQSEVIFNPGWQVFTERAILTGEGQEYRPDRVLVNDNSAIVCDFKFGSHENPAYPRQLRKYIKLLNEIGYKNVKAYIWYVILDKWEEVACEA